MKNLKVILGVLTFTIAIGTALASNSLSVYVGYRSNSQTGSSCFTYSSIPDDCLTENSGQQCAAIVDGRVYFLWASLSNGFCINVVKLPQ